MKQMKRMLAFLLSVMMVVTVIPAELMVDASTSQKVTVSVEKFVLGQGYLVSPTTVTVKKGTDVATAVETVLNDNNIKYNVDYTYGYYLTDMEDKNRGDVTVSTEVQNAIKGIGQTFTTVDATPDTLGSGDYCSYAGWMYSVNDDFKDTAMNDTVLSNGDVVRVQFSLTAGSDVNPNYAYGTPVYPNMPSRTQLTKIYGYLNGKKETETENYKNGLSVITNLASTKEQMDAAVKAFDVEVAEEEQVSDDVKVHTVKTVSASKIKSVRNKTYDTMKKKTFTYGSEWNVIALKRAGKSGCTSIYNAYLKDVKAVLKKNKGTLPNGKPTDYARVSLALTALGKNAKKFNGYNVMKVLGDYDAVTGQGLNAVITALEALDSGKYNVPTVSETTQATRKSYIEYICKKQLAGGGFTYSGTVADADMTAMAITALAPYYNSSKYGEVKTVIDDALAALSDMQQSNGSFYSGNVCNAESNAQVIVALTSVGVNPKTDKRFLKNKKSAVDALLSFATSSGKTFKHTYTGKSNSLATSQAAYALAAYKRFKEGKSALFRVK
ncbi:MAG: hypothetical protein K6A30_07050 [Lachnospiraceae bacterium]|nr:hypothetical protein [Lachnospiraceae bacterium]